MINLFANLLFALNDAHFIGGALCSPPFFIELVSFFKDYLTFVQLFSTGMHTVVCVRPCVYSKEHPKDKFCITSFRLGDGERSSGNNHV